jgi:hypothetical protein
MDECRIRAAILAHRRLKRVYRFPERAPEWAEIMADLADAEAYYRGLGELTPDQALDYQRVLAAFKKKH